MKFKIYFTPFLGKISTYKSLARVIGTPKAYRAVGSSLRRNPFAPQVPCHRVVRKNGVLGGYKWGIEKKAALLKSERV